jgi:hypothetical protein
MNRGARGTNDGERLDGSGARLLEAPSAAARESATPAPPRALGCHQFARTERLEPWPLQLESVGDGGVLDRLRDGSVVVPLGLAVDAGLTGGSASAGGSGDWRRRRSAATATPGRCVQRAPLGRRAACRSGDRRGRVRARAPSG